MKLRLTKAAAVATLVAGALFAAPAAALAYTPTAPDGNSTSVAPGGTVTVPFNGFAPNEGVTFTLTGENGAGASLAAAKFVVNSSAPLTKTANAAGNVSVAVTLPTNAVGNYTLVADGAISPSVTVTIAATPVAGGGAGTLPATGGDNAALLGLWIGGGALVLAGGSIAVASTVRRHRNAEVAA